MISSEQKQCTKSHKIIAVRSQTLTEQSTKTSGKADNALVKYLSFSWVSKQKQQAEMKIMMADGFRTIQPFLNKAHELIP